MARLFYQIYKATVMKDMNAAWGLVLNYEPFINKICWINPNEIEEDLKSEILIELLRRIKNFDIFYK